MKKKIISGIQPTNKLTIGNYFGAISNLKEFQKEYSLIIFVADLHALTMWDNCTSSNVLENKKKLIASYCACGLDIENNLLFFQSDVPSHTQLGWVLICATTIGELNKMTQFKDKSTKSTKENGTNFIPTGLLVYPPLMAADILLYDSDYVYVGLDQKQHVELTRNIAMRFNNKFKTNIFTIPEPLIPDTGKKIMGLLDPIHKMSKSNKNENDTIFLLDEPEVARKKIMGSLTDCLNIVKFDFEKQPGISNLMNIYSALTNKSISDIEKKYKEVKNYGEFKKDVANEVVLFLTDFQEKYYKIYNDIDKYLAIVKKCSDKCNEIGNKKVDEIYKIIGLR